jgi:outer membrane lipoprotein-sorting protein
MKFNQIVPALIVFAITFGGPSHAQAQAGPQAVTAGQAADLTRIEGYLNGLTTAQANFTFVGPDGNPTRGIFYLSRPSKLRFEYTQPKGNLLIADGDYVIFWDAQQKEASNLPIGSTPLDFLLRPKISLTDGVRVTAFEHTAGVIRVTLTQAQKDADGTVTVAFSDSPLELRGWRLIDGQGQITDVSFSDWTFGATLDPGLFKFQDPNGGKRHR